MADNNQSENLNDSPESEGSETTQQPQQKTGGGVSQRTASLAKTGLETGVKATGAAIGGPVGAGVVSTILKNPVTPGLLALFLILLAFGAILAVGFGIIGYSGDNGGSPQEKAAVGNKQDSLDVKTIQCLDKTSKIDAKGAGKLPPECIKPIQDWSQISINMVNAMLSKVPKTPEGEKATKLLNDLLAAANEAHGVTAQTTLKQARELRKKLEDALAAANANAIIQKLSGISPNAQRVIDYVQSKGQKTNQGGGKPGLLADCRGMSEAVLRALFKEASGWDDRPSATIGGYDPSDNLPSETAIQETRNILLKGDLPIWHIAGENSGKHFIVVLNIDNANTFTIYDPDGGRIRVMPSNAPGPVGKEKYFFGSPYGDWIGKNARIRGMVFPASTMTPLDNPGDPIVGY